MNTSNSWHLLDNGEVLRLLTSDMYRGLTSKEAKKRRRTAGSNSVWHVKRTPAGEIALSALFDLPTLLLAVSAGAAAVFDKRFEAGAIAAVLVIGALLRTAAAVRANRILEDMARERIPHSSVIRDGRIHLLSAEEIVPGDIIFLEAGDTVPCDGRVMTGEDAVVSERGITENNLPVHKFNTVIATDADSGEIPCEFRSNMLFAGSLVLSGSVRIAATACGENTLVSMKQGGVTIETEHSFPLVERLRRSGRTVSLCMLAAVLVLTVLSLFVGEGFTLPDVFLCTMAMAVAAMSEFMPAVASIILAAAVRDAASGREPLGWRDAAKRRLGDAKAAVRGNGEREYAGSRAVFRDPSRMEEVAYPDAVVFCGTDFFKSGNAELLAYRFRGTYTGIDERGGDPSELLALALAATSQTASRSAERDGQKTGVSAGGSGSVSHKAAGRAALVASAADACVHRTGKPLGYGFALADHRDSTDRLAMNCEISLAAVDGELWAVACGALQDVLACCSTVECASGTVPLTDDARRQYFSEAAALEVGGARVLAVARRTSPYPQLNRLAVLTQAMSFTGFFAVALEPEEGARENIELLKKSGVCPILFTETPDEDRYYGSRIGLFERDTPVIPFAEWNAIRAKELLSDGENAPHGLIVSFEDIGDNYLGGAYVQAMTALGAADGEAVVSAVGREAWDAGALGRADFGFAVTRSKTRAVPDALARNAAAVIWPGDGCAAGFGGLDGVRAAIRTAQRVLANTETAKFYLTASQTARLLTVLAAILGWIPLCGAVFLLIWGLIFDFAAMLVQAFERDGRPPRTKPTQETDRRRTGLAIVSGILWGIPLAALPILFAHAPALSELWSPESARAMLSAAAILSGLAFSAECGTDGSLFLKREFNLAQAIFAAASVLFAAWILFTRTGAALVGGLPCGLEGLCAVLPAAFVFLASEIRKVVQKESNREK
ncbi:MAG: cation-transporting P-type ATPase [Clostridia bacterium]|nr:cation-transporting P-type ATPase [Clostridia bacterium]